MKYDPSVLPENNWNEITRQAFILIVGLLNSLEEEGVELPEKMTMARLKKYGFEGQAMMDYAQRLVDDKDFWASVPEGAKPLEQKLLDILVKYNQQIV